MEALDNLVPEQSRVLLTYGGGSIVKNGILDAVKTELAKSERTVLEFGGIEPNPKFETLMKAVELARTEKVDFLLAVGGGSVMDGTKFIALAAGSDEFRGEEEKFSLWFWAGPRYVGTATGNCCDPSSDRFRDEQWWSCHSWDR